MWIMRNKLKQHLPPHTFPSSAFTSSFPAPGEKNGNAAEVSPSQPLIVTLHSSHLPARNLLGWLYCLWVLNLCKD